MNFKGNTIMIAFRLSSFFTRSRLLKVIGFPVRISYKFIIQWILGIDLPDKTKVGKDLNIYHGQGLVINENVIIGDYVILRQNTTIGEAQPGGRCPVIGNNVNVGANTVIIGDISIGDNSIIGAGSVVVKSFPSDVVIAGNPARIIKEQKNSL